MFPPGKISAGIAKKKTIYPRHKCVIGQCQWVKKAHCRSRMKIGRHRAANRRGLAARRKPRLSAGPGFLYCRTFPSGQWDLLMAEATIDVAGIGNAIVDVIAHADDALLAAEGFAKGSMTLIDAARADALYARIGPAIE